MSKRVGIEVSIAAAEAAKLANVDVVSAYPITPQTHIVEHMADIIANGELDAEFVCVESEHSAMSACLGAAASGARTFTATAGQGLELMHEVVYCASSMRLPIVMTVANRALSSPLSVWGDHSDAMAVRDTGWIQVFAENGQQVVDFILWGFRVAEHRRVLFPVMIHLDGFNLSHVVEPIFMPEQAEVDRYLPEHQYPYPLHPDKPVTMGAYGPPFIYMETKKAQEEALNGTRDFLLSAWKEFGDIFDRHYAPVETYRMEGAEIALFTMGSIGETAHLTVDKLRSEGLPIGLVKLVLWRPFPFQELREVLCGLQLLVVLDRCISFGGPGGPVASEIRACLYQEKDRPFIASFVAGLGGRNIYLEDFELMVKKAREQVNRGIAQDYEMIGVRE